MSDERNTTDDDVTNIAITSLPHEAGGSPPDSRVVTIHAHVLEQLQLAQRSLLSLQSLPSLMKYLLEDLPQNFGSDQAELRLYDGDGSLAPLLPMRRQFGESLQLMNDTYGLYQLYADSLDTTLMQLKDARMFKILPGANKASGAAILPLFDGNRLVGSYHLALLDVMEDYAENEKSLLSMLAQLISAALIRIVEYQRLDRLTLLHPVTELGNARALDKNLLREVFWARRVEQPVSLLVAGLDGIGEIARSYGEFTSQFVQRRVGQRLCSNLRVTDHIAQTASGRFALLLPSCNESQAHSIGERLRGDIDRLAIDDGRGAVLYVTLSIGLVCWDPSRHPMNASDRLAQQMNAEAEAAMMRSEQGGGNRLSVGRVALLML